MEAGFVIRKYMVTNLINYWRCHASNVTNLSGLKKNTMNILACYNKYNNQTNLTNEWDN